MLKFVVLKRWAARQQLQTWLFIGSAILLVAAGSLWWFRVQTDPVRVFWGMLEQSLRMSSVTMQASSQEDGSGTAVQHSLQYSLGGDAVSRSVTTISQPGTSLTTEVLGTPDADYTRYSDIQTDEVGRSGEPLDVSSVEGVWAHTQHQGGSGGSFGQAALGLGLPLGALPVPIANMGPPQRAQLLDQMRRDNVYDIVYGDTEKRRVDGRLHYVYNARIQLMVYADLMKRFGSLAGLHDLDNLDPNIYSGAAPLDVAMTVDVRSRQLVGVEVDTPDGPYSQTYGGYDIPARIALPEDAITASELQRRLQDLE